MKSLVSLLTLTATLALPFAAASVARADELPGLLCKTVFDSPVTAISATGKKLKRAGLSAQAYVTDWSTLSAKGTGPFRSEGAMLVSPIKSTELATWMEKIGNDSIGFMVEKLPENIGHTAHLRVGDELYTFNEIQTDDFRVIGNANTREIRKLTSMIQADSRYAYTELTIPVSRAEKAAVLEFLELRRSAQFIAQFDVKRGPKKGELIDPDFDDARCTLLKESCGGTATSPFNPLWLEHFKSPAAKVLSAMADRLNLEATPVAKRTIWAHVRNPETPVMTLIGVDRSENADLQHEFIRDNSWGHLRGLPIYGLMPDPQSGKTSTIKSTRTPLNEWLERTP